MQKLKTDFKYLIVLFLFSLVGILLTYAHHGNLLIDNGREAYYPTQVLLGKILYKDIFNVYGPFSYMLNALLFKLFGINLNVLYIVGSICAISIISLIYLIARKFLSEFLSFSIGILTISVGLLYSGLFNFIFPYSYAILYGILAFLISFWFLLKYEKNSDNTKFLYLSCFFAGVCITNKYEFLPYLAVILYSMIKIKPLNLKEYCYSFFSILFIPFLCFGILFLQGLRLADLVITAKYINNMAHGKALNFFYRYSGVYFCDKTLNFLFTIFLKTSILCTIFVYSFTKLKKIFLVPVIIVTSIIMLYLVDYTIFLFLPALILILTLIHFKKIINNQKLLLLALSGITISLKIFWGLTTTNYGVFFLSFLLITLLAIGLDIFKNKTINQKAIGIFIIVITLILGYKNILTFKGKSFCLKTDRGIFHVDESFYIPTNELIKYINEKTKPTDKILILPEGAMINFLTNRPTDNFYISLIPPYIDAFGEKNIIEHFKNNKPDYIIFNNWNTQDYGFSYICKDYATSFCNYVQQNYHLQSVIANKLFYLIYKKN